MRLGSWQFAPGLWPTLVTIVLLGLLTSLGFWQLDRAEQKRRLLAQYEQLAGDRSPLRPDPRAELGPEFNYRGARVSGYYDGAHQFLLDNRTLDGQPGYEVITPLVTGDGAAFLVNRGWIPLGPGRDRLPEVTVDGQPRSVSGQIKLPPSRVFMLAEEQPRRVWPYRVQHIDVERFERELGYPVSSYMLLLDPSAPDGYRRNWQPVQGFGPERNVGYAVQWFGLAAALLVIYLVVNLRKVNSDE
jgi:surfeit locus 1 family protein